SRKPCNLSTTRSARGCDLLDAAEMGGDACAARLRAVLLVPHAVDVSGGRSRDALGLLRRDGPVNGLDLLGYHRYQHRAHVLHCGRDVRRHRPLRLHNQARSIEVRLFPDHGPDRRRDRKPADLNPIEMPFSEVKAFLRKFSERTIRGLCKRIGSFVPTTGCGSVAITSGMPAMHPYDRNLL